MFAVGDVLISDSVLDAEFSCHLTKCLGGCCVQGDFGAPLEESEIEKLEEALPVVREMLTPDALDVIEDRGVWEHVEPGKPATTCVGDEACVFVTYDGPVALCSIQTAFYEGKLDWEKPISCHLYPIRISNYHGQDVLNYEQIPLCAPACTKGRRKGVQLFDFLKRPLIRRYGETWYEQFRKECIRRMTARDHKGGRSK